MSARIPSTASLACVVARRPILQTIRASTRSLGQSSPTTRRPTTAVFRARFPALPDPYRPQSNDPVRRGVLRFRNCARPGPPWRRYKSHPAGRLKNRSLLLKEPVHGHACHHAHPARGYLSKPSSPLDAQFVERLLILRRKLSRSSISFWNASRLRTSKYVRFPSTATSPLICAASAQQLRHQQASLAIHLHLLAPVVHAVQELLLRRIESGEPGQLLLDPLPFLEGIYLGNLSVQTCDVELRARISRRSPA